MMTILRFTDPIYTKSFSTLLPEKVARLKVHWSVLDFVTDDNVQEFEENLV